MIASDVGRAIVIGAIPVLLENGAPLAIAYVLVFIAALFSAVFNPARIALIPLLVPPARLGAANSTIASTDRTVEILGAVAAGFLVASTEERAFYVDAATF